MAVAELMNELRTRAVNGGDRRSSLAVIDQLEAAFSIQETALTHLHQQLSENEQERIQQIRELVELRAKLFVLEEKLRIQMVQRFGRSSEKWSHDQQLQALLFNELEQLIQEQTPEQDSSTSDDQKIEAKAARAAQRKLQPEGGRRALPEHLPREITTLDLSAEQQVCECGQTKEVIGVDVLERLQMKPIEYYVERIERVIRACPAGCGCPQCVPAVPQLIEKSMIGSSVAAHFVIGKFCDSLPFNRQETIFRRDTIDISRQTMGRVAGAIATRLLPIIERLDALLLLCQVWGIDETRVRVLNEYGIKKDGSSYMWCTAGEKPPPEDRPSESPIKIVRYDLGPGRGSAVARRRLAGFTGVVVTDDYAAYDEPVRTAGITHARCMAHVRRKFHDVLKSDSRHEQAREAVTYIAKLYEIEKRYADARAEERLTGRQREAKPVFAEFRRWLYTVAQTMMPESAFGKAVNYTIKNLEPLAVYLDNPWVPIDNNRVENAIRPFAVGRKNWLFNSQATGAEASAILYSIIETAKANRVEPFHYLRFVLACMERFPQDQMPWDHLLPTPAIRDYAASIGISWDFSD